MVTRRARQAGLTAAALCVAALGAYFGAYVGLLEPEMRRLARGVALTSPAPDQDLGSGTLVPLPEDAGDAGSLYQQAVDVARDADPSAVEDLVAVSTHAAPPRPGLRVDVAGLSILRRAAGCRQATLPGSPVRRLERRAAAGEEAAAYRDPTHGLCRMTRALIGAGEVHLAAGRAEEAAADFRAAYQIGRHLTAGAGDIEVLVEGLTVRRMACSGLNRLAERRGQTDLALRLKQHGSALARIRTAVRRRQEPITGTEPKHLQAVIRVAGEHADPIWRREAVVALIRLTRLGVSDSAWAWLIRRRARRALADLADDPDPVVCALARRAIGLEQPAASRPR